MVNDGINSSLRRLRPEGGSEDEGPAKKHKADEPSTPDSKPGFAEVLKQFKESEQSSVEGGADKWKQPPLSKDIDPEKDSLTFQQIDIGKGADGVIQMFGITEEGHTVLALIACRTPFGSVKSFMKDANLVGMSWVEIPATKYQLVADGAKISRCQVEISVKYESMVSRPPTGEWSKIAPVRILSFDIECSVRGRTFPEHIHDPVIQIANIVTQNGENKPFIRNVFTLKSCADISGAEVKTFDNEKDLLEAWSEFVRTLDPDLVIGFNIFDFDIRYLIDRAKHIGAKNVCSLSRLLGSSATYKARRHLMYTSTSGEGSQPMSTNRVRYAPLEGRLQLDLFPFFRREILLQKEPGSAHGPYSLAGVSHHFLEESKEDVHFTQITGMFNGDEFDRQKLAVYCLKDAYLPLQLLDEVDAFSNYVEKARAEVGMLFNDVVFRT